MKTWQRVTDHPQDRARQLFELVGAAPAGLHRSQAEVTDLHRQILVEENIWGEEVVRETRVRILGHTDGGQSR